MPSAAQTRIGRGRSRGDVDSGSLALQGHSSAIDSSATESVLIKSRWATQVAPDSFGGITTFHLGPGQHGALSSSAPTQVGQPVGSL
jgi:hypothetical protein